MATPQLVNIYNKREMHECQDEPHTYIPPNMVKFKFNWFLLWALGAAALYGSALYDNPGKVGYQLTYFVLLLHAIVFTILTAALWAKAEWNPVFSSMIGALWILSSFVFLGVVVLIFTAPDLLNDTTNNNCNGVGAALSSQFSIHVLPLVSLATVTGFPSELRATVPTLWSSSAILIYLSMLTSAQVSFISVYKVKFVTEALATMASLYFVAALGLELIFHYVKNTRMQLELYTPASINSYGFSYGTYYAKTFMKS